MSIESVLQANNLSKSFGDYNVFSNLKLSIKRGETVCLLGLSGSGKTTLLGIISGLNKPDTGQVLIAGDDIYEPNVERARYIGMIFQNFALLEDLTALENIIVARWHLMQDEDKITREILPVLSKVGLIEHMNKYPSQLSSGLKQRVAMARALVNNPLLLVADEPTASLDTINKIAIMNILVDISNNRSLIYSTHDIEMAKFADRIIMLKNGSLKDISKNQLKQSNKISDLY